MRSSGATGAARADAGPQPAPAAAGRPMAGSFLTTGVIQGAQAVVGVILARALGPSGRGDLAAVMLWPTLLVTIGSLGITQSATYYSARSESTGSVVGSTLAIVAALSLALVGIGLLVIPAVLSDHGRHVVHLARVYLLLFVPVNLLGISMMAVLNGTHRFAWFQGLRLAWMATILGVVGALYASDNLRTGTAITAYLAATGLMAVASTIVALSSAGRLQLRRQVVKSLLVFGGKSQLSVSLWNLNERADQLVISIFFSATSLGLYVVAVTMTSLTTLIGFSFALVALPILARLGTGHEGRETARLLLSTTLVAATAVTIPLLLLEPALIRLLFGADFSGAVDVGRVLLVAGVVFALNRVLEAVLQGIGRPLDSSIGEGIALAVTAAGLAALLPAIGTLGAGITSLLAYSASAFFLVRRAGAGLDMSVRELLLPTRGMARDLRELFRRRSSVRPEDMPAAAETELELEGRA